MNAAKRAEDLRAVFPKGAPAEKLTPAVIEAHRAESEASNARMRASGKAASRAFTGESITVFGDLA